MGSLGAHGFKKNEDREAAVFETPRFLESDKAR